MWATSVLGIIQSEMTITEHSLLEYNPIFRLIFPADPKVIIIDEEGVPVQDKYYEVDSTMQLSCVVRHVRMTSSAVYWSHGDRILNYDVDRGGVR